MAKMRLTYFDLLRIIAVVLVVFNHLPGYTLYYSNEGVLAWIYMAITMVTRINVPLFLMISGALLLGKDESVGHILRHRVSRIVGAILFSGIGLSLLRGGVSENLLTKLLAGGVSASYWFLYAYLGFLLMLPFLRKIAQRLTASDIKYLCVVHGLFSALSPVLAFFSLCITGEAIRVDLTIPLFTEKTIFYPLLGYYLAREFKIERLGIRGLRRSALLAVSGIMVASFFTYLEGVTLGYTQNFVQMFDWLIAAFVFVAMRWLFEVHRPSTCCDGALARFARFFGPLTFGVYLFDPWLKVVFWNSFVQLTEPYLITLAVSALWCIFSFFAGSMLTYFAKRIPVIRRAL